MADSEKRGYLENEECFSYQIKDIFIITKELSFGGKMKRKIADTRDLYNF